MSMAVVASRMRLVYNGISERRNFRLEEVVQTAFDPADLASFAALPDRRLDERCFAKSLLRMDGFGLLGLLV